jgi:hypothetical protein
MSESFLGKTAPIERMEPSSDSLVDVEATPRLARFREVSRRDARRTASRLLLAADTATDACES